MADQSDVEQAIVNLVGTVLYPSGQSGSPPLSVLGCAARVYRGWPNADALDADLGAGVLNVSVYPWASGGRNTTRYAPRWGVPLGLPATTYTLTQSGQTVTVGGAAPSTYFAQNLAIFVNGVPYIVTATSGQTAAQLAAALQALIVVAIGGTTVSGAVITLPDSARIGALRVGSSGIAQEEMKREEKPFQISFWSPTPQIRDQACSLVDAALSAVTFIALPDGTAARLRYQGTRETDAPEKENLYRRDLIETAEWGTGPSQPAVEIIAIQTNVDDCAGDVLQTSYS